MLPATPVRWHWRLFVGDLVGGSSSMSATVAQWEEFKDATAAFNGQIYAVPGN